MKQRNFYRLVASVVLILAVLVLAGFGPDAQGVQRFVTIITQKITVQTDITVPGTANFDGTADFDGAANFDGAADFDSTVDFSGATVTGVSTSTLSTLTVDGATTLSGTVTVSSATTMADTLNMSNKAISNIGAAGTDFSATGGLTLADDLNMSNQPIVNVGAAGTDFGADGGLTLAAGLTVSAGNTDLAGTLQYGADNLYPLGYASANQQTVCGTTATFTATTEIVPTGITTSTYPIAIQITQPAATAAYLTATDPTTASFTLQSWGADYNAGTTGIAAHWCVVGDQ